MMISTLQCAFHVDWVFGALFSGNFFIWFSVIKLQEQKNDVFFGCEF